MVRTSIALPAAPSNDRAADPGRLSIRQQRFFRVHVYRAEGEIPPAKRVFFLINGLNEIYEWGLYDGLAARLIEKGGAQTRCLLVPAPFHLDRYPDDAHVRDRHQRVTPLDYFFAHPLALWEMYRRQLEEISAIGSFLKGSTETAFAPEQFDRFDRAQFDSHFAELAAQVANDVRIHLVGFSLGGLAALAAQVVNPRTFDGCAAICSGAALASLHLDPLCQEEEWQNLLIELRFELDRLDSSGPRANRHVDLWQAFNEIYARTSEYAFRNRIDGFRRRVLFVIGGRDPIAPLDAIVQPTGREATILSLAEVQHFVHRDDAWNAWSELTVEGILQAAGIATSNCLADLTPLRSPAGKVEDIGNTRVEPQRVIDDLTYLVRILRAAEGGRHLGDEKTFLHHVHEVCVGDPPWEWVPEEVRRRLEVLARHWDLIPESDRHRIVHEQVAPSLATVGRGRISHLELQLIKLFHIEHGATFIDCAMIDLPAIFHTRQFLVHRSQQVFSNDAEGDRYRLATLCRQEHLRKRLRAKNVIVRLLLPHGFFGRLLSNQGAVPRTGNHVALKAGAAVDQIDHLAEMVERHGTTLHVGIANEKEPLVRSFYLGHEDVRASKSSDLRGVELSGAGYDRRFRATALSHPILQSYAMLFDHYWPDRVDFYDAARIRGAAR